jgi:serine/threonine protein kinase
MYTLEQGQKFERYRILRTLGSGVAGISYQAEDTRKKQPVMLKLIHPWAPLPDQARRQFFRDTQVISGLSHPLLSPLLNYGEVHGQLFVVRPFTTYGSLLSSEGRRWFQTPLPISKAFTYALQIARVLAYIHSNGYIHGSLTLSNILITHTPCAEEIAALVLTDIKLASFVRQYGQPINTLLPTTAAPEQFQQQQGPATDQYALAVLLYFWITGHLPFQGSVENIQQSKQQEDFPALHMFNPEINPEQEQLILKGLHPAPGERYPSMDNFAHELALMLTHMPPINLQPQPSQHPDPTQETLQSQTEAITPDHRSTATHPAETLSDTLIAPQEHQPEMLAPERISDALPTGAILSSEAVTDAQQKTTEPLAVVSSAPLQATDAYLVITSPYQHEPAIYHLTQITTTVGHSGDSSVLLDHDELISRHHALILRQQQHYLIYDQRSTHGVKVNTTQLTEGEGYQLANGDQIYIGVYTLTFYYAQPHAQASMVRQHILS